MYFGTEAGSFKAVGLQETSVDVIGAASGVSGLWGAKAGRAETIQ